MKSTTSPRLAAFFSVAVVIIGAAAGPSPEPQTLSEEILQNTFSVFSLTYAQDRSIDRIIARFPDLREDATMAKIEFDHAFGPAIEAVDEYLTENATADLNWPKLREKLKAEVQGMDFSRVTREQAEGYIQTVKRRTKGDIPQRIYEVKESYLLSHAQRASRGYELRRRGGGFEVKEGNERAIREIREAV